MRNKRIVKMVACFVFVLCITNMLAFETAISVKAATSRVYFDTFSEGVGNWRAAFGGTVSVAYNSPFGTALKLSGRTQAWHSPKLNIYNMIKNYGAGTYNITMKILVDKVDPLSHYTRMIIRGDGENSFIKKYGSNYYCAVSPPIEVTPKEWCYLSGNIDVKEEDIQNSTGKFELMIDVLNYVQGQNIYIDDVYIYKVTPTNENFSILSTGKTLTAGQMHYIQTTGSSNVKFKTSNNEIATVDEYGCITAKNKGRARIEVKDNSSGQCLYFFVNVEKGWHSIKKGTYYIKNNEICCYMQPDDNDRGILEIWDFDNTNNKQEWYLESLVGGYYRIKSVANNKVVTVSDEDNDNVTLTYNTYNNSDNQHWYIEPLYDGTYKIWPKSAEDYGEDFCMSIDDSLFTGEAFFDGGRNVRQMIYSDTSMNKWEIFTPDLKVWNANVSSDEGLTPSNIGYWEKVPTIYFENKTNSENFYIESAKQNAVEQWSNSLDIYIYIYIYICNAKQTLCLRK